MKSMQRYTKHQIRDEKAFKYIAVPRTLITSRIFILCIRPRFTVDIRIQPILKLRTKNEFWN